MAFNGGSSNGFHVLLKRILISIFGIAIGIGIGIELQPEVAASDSDCDCDTDSDDLTHEKLRRAK